MHVTDKLHLHPTNSIKLLLSTLFKNVTVTDILHIMSGLLIKRVGGDACH